MGRKLLEQFVRSTKQSSGLFVGEGRTGESPILHTNKKGTFVYQKFLFLLSKPQAWYGINTLRALYGTPTKSRMALREARTP